MAHDRTPTSERRAELRAAAAFIIATAAAVGLAAVYVQGGNPKLEGILLFLAFGGLSFGFITWGNHLLPQGPFTGDREELASPQAEVAGVEADFSRQGEITRRRLLVRTLSVAAGAVGAAALFPLRSLGPRPGNALAHTPWRRGLRAVTEDGTPVRAADIPLEGLATVFPEGYAGSADGQAVVMRVAPGLLQPLPGRAGWAPENIIGYSKVCTHAGCPVGLYDAQNHQLICPCHQSGFDVLRGARPVFGPAAARLPQLPLAVDAAGYLVATGDFSEPIGPAYWGRK
jgi:ubiquinol-cytochrome c reductase iron-sulfur subunit